MQSITEISLMPFPFYLTTGEQCRYRIQSSLAVRRIWLFNIDIICTIFYFYLTKFWIFVFSVCKALVWWGTDKPPCQSRKVCLSNVGCRCQSGIWERQGQRSWLVMSCSDYVKWSNCLPSVLGLCKGLGFASNEFQKSMA